MPARRIELGLADGHTKTLEIGSKTTDGKYHAREVSRDLVAVIPAALVDDLAKGMDELRAKRIADIATYPWYGSLVLNNIYEAAEFLQVHTYENVVRWAKAIEDRPAVARGRRVNRVWGPEEERVPERHSAADIA